MSYIIERPAGMPDWVEIGIKVIARNGENEVWSPPEILTGVDMRSRHGIWFLTPNMGYRYAKPYTPWTPKEGEWVRVWNKIAEPYDMVRINQYKIRNSNGRYIVGDYEWDYCARITNDDGSLIDIRCTVDELKAKTDWLGPEEE